MPEKLHLGHPVARRVSPLAFHPAGFIGASTEAIDSPSIDRGLLGKRFTSYRMTATSADDEVTACLLADANAGQQPAIRAERARAVRDFSDGLAIPDLLASLTVDEQDRLITLATIGSRCRSSVVSDSYSREVELVPSHERSPGL